MAHTHPTPRSKALDVRLRTRKRECPKRTISAELERAVQDRNLVLFDLIKLELELAFTFCKGAITTRDLEHKERALFLAQTAFATAAKAAEWTALSADMHKEIETRKEKLNSVLPFTRTSQDGGGCTNNG